MKVRNILTIVLVVTVMILTGCGGGSSDSNGGGGSANNGGGGTGGISGVGGTPYEQRVSIRFYSGEDYCFDDSHSVYFLSYTPSSQYPGDTVNLDTPMDVYYNDYPASDDFGYILPKGSYEVCYQRDCGVGIRHTLERDMFLDTGYSRYSVTKYTYQVGLAAGLYYDTDSIDGPCPSGSSGTSGSHGAACADSITHNGVMYCTITSPDTGRVWLDRNLGASEVCGNSTTTACYGDYYQWGRGTDGHEKRNSSSFILSDNDWTSTDRYGNQRASYWSKTDGSSICPIGYRVPSKEEITSESGIYKAAPGGRIGATGTIEGEETPVTYLLWSTSYEYTDYLDKVSPAILYVEDDTPSYSYWHASAGLHVRCIKD